VIDPRSKTYSNWEAVLVAMLAFCATVTPFEVAFLVISWRDSLFWLNRIVDLTFLLDMGINLNLGFPNPIRKAEIVTDHQKIIPRYLRGWFTIDLLCLVPLETADSSLKAIRILRLLRLIKVTKLKQATEIVKRWQIKTGTPFSTVNLLKQIMVIFLSVHWMACLFFLFTALEEPSKFQTTPAGRELASPSWIEQEYYNTHSEWVPQEDIPAGYRYCICLYYSMFTLTTIGYGDVALVKSSERWISVLMLQLLGAALYAYMIAIATMTLASMNSFSLSANMKVDDLYDFSEAKDLPHEVTVRAREFLEFSQRAWKRESWFELMESMPPALRGQLVGHALVKYIAKSELLGHFHEHHVMMLAQRFRPVAYPRGELIQCGGCYLQNMYFIHSGFCLQVCNMLRAGDSFGHEALLTDACSWRPVVAFTDVLLFELNIYDVMEQRALNPTLNYEIRRWAIKYSFARDTRKIIRRLRPHAFSLKGQLREDYREVLWGAHSRSSETSLARITQARFDLQTVTTLYSQILERQELYQSTLEEQTTICRKMARQMHRARPMLTAAGVDTEVDKMPLLPIPEMGNSDKDGDTPAKDISNSDKDGDTPAKDSDKDGDTPAKEISNSDKDDDTQDKDADAPVSKDDTPRDGSEVLPHLVPRLQQIAKTHTQIVGPNLSKLQEIEDKLMQLEMNSSTISQC